MSSRQCGETIGGATDVSGVGQLHWLSLIRRILRQIDLSRDGIKSKTHQYELQVITNVAGAISDVLYYSDNLVTQCSRRATTLPDIMLE